MVRAISQFKWAVVVFAASIVPAVTQAQGNTPPMASGLAATSSPDNTAEIAARGVIIIREFSVNDRTGWPYDIKQLQSQTVAELRAKYAASFDISVGPPATARAHTYTLDGEVVSWRPGNK